MCQISAWYRTKMQTVFLLIPTSGPIFTPNYTFLPLQPCPDSSLLIGLIFTPNYTLLPPGPDSNLLTNLWPPINPVTRTMN